ncbi:uncharacterized protein ARMOST_20916 [Armillaria ostoyae]|uniref:F-box domain-containing protein n=1 Tax=Armillaria ostoyae TaxID=47428 RepID=A0A284S8S7_ARMOS|nr:uncharacterized protein ARMOST_20916 [Armillaria ostoyae]
MNSTLHELPDDVLIYNIALLSIPDILLLRQTCKRFSALTRLHIVWTNASELGIVVNNHPFSSTIEISSITHVTHTDSGPKLNADTVSEADVAVSLSQRIDLLHLGDNGTLHNIRAVETNLRPVNINGGVKSLADDVPKTVIYSWKTEERAHLDDVGDNQHDRCLQVVFTAPIILVIRARSITLYTAPPTRSFG